MVINPLDALGPVGLAAGGGALLATIIARRNAAPGPNLQATPAPSNSPSGEETETTAKAPAKTQQKAKAEAEAPKRWRTHQK